jgi:hypothetical protein
VYRTEGFTSAADYADYFFDLELEGNPFFEEVTKGENETEESFQYRVLDAATVEDIYVTQLLTDFLEDTPYAYVRES